MQSINCTRLALQETLIVIPEARITVNVEGEANGHRIFPPYVARGVFESSKFTLCDSVALSLTPTTSADYAIKKRPEGKWYRQGGGETVDWCWERRQGFSLAVLE